VPYAQTPSPDTCDVFADDYTGVLDRHAKFITPVGREPDVATEHELRTHISEHFHAGCANDVGASRVRQAAALSGYESGTRAQARAALVRYLQILRAWECPNPASTALADPAEEVEGAAARVAAADDFALDQPVDIFAADVVLQLTGGAR